MSGAIGLVVVGALLLALAMPNPASSAVAPFGHTLASLSSSNQPRTTGPAAASVPSTLRLRGGIELPGFGGGKKDKDAEEKKKAEAKKLEEEEKKIAAAMGETLGASGLGGAPAKKPEPTQAAPPPPKPAAASPSTIDDVRSKLAELKAEVKQEAKTAPPQAQSAPQAQGTSPPPVFTPAPAPEAPKVPAAEEGGPKMRPRLMQPTLRKEAVTRSESYSVLDEGQITSILRSPSQVPEEALEAEREANQKPLPVAETKQQPQPQAPAPPAPPAPPKGMAEAWIKAAHDAIQRAKDPSAGKPKPPPLPIPGFDTKPASVTTPPPAKPAETVTAPPTAPPQTTTTSPPPRTAEQQIQETVEAVEEIIDEAPPEDEGKFRIVIVSSEVAPFSKSGGLADVADKLAVALSQMGHRVMTVSPSYRNYDGAIGTEVRRQFNLYGGSHDIHYTHKWEPTNQTDVKVAMGVDRVFVQNAAAFERAGMYGDPGGHDYFDNLFRFALFSWAALEAPLILPAIAPFGDKVIFIANDWQCGLVPLILASHYRRWKVFGPSRCLFIIHNMGYHGNFPNPQMYNYDLPDPRDTPKWSFQDLGLADNSYYDMFKWIFPEEMRGDGGEVDDGECIKLLLGGIMMSDRVVTVSPAYKEEIMTEQGGWSLQNKVRERQDRLDGILNGIDTQQWNPETDQFLPAHYSPKNLTGKAICKQKLQESLGLHQDPNAPLIAFIGRLAPQKGVDVIAECFGWMMGGDDQGVLGDCQLVMMGSGQAEYADFMRSAEAQHKGRVCGYVGFSSEMEHLIIAGADILLMPSRYEPCGLPQMYAQRYGTVPVVHATGGLKDSVEQYELSETEGAKGTGWKFGNCDANGLRWGLWSALQVCKQNTKEWDGIIQRGMARDFSWRKSAEQYVQLMEWAMMDPPRCEPWPFHTG